MSNNTAIPEKGPSSAQYGPGKLTAWLLASSLLLLTFFSTLYLLNIDFIETINLKTLDVLQRSVDRSDDGDDIVTVVIDEASLERYGQWPWSRTRLAQLLGGIADMGAKSIGIVMLLPEREGLPVPGEAVPPHGQEQVMKNLAAEREMAEVLKNGPFVFGYEFLFEPGRENGVDCLLHQALLQSPVKKELSELVDFYRASDVVCSSRILSEAIHQSGFLNGTPDRDGVLRRLPLLIAYEGKYYPSFALGVLMQYKREDLLTLKKDERLIPRLSLADLQIPLDEHGNFLLGYQTPGNTQYISALDVLEGKVVQHDFADKIVLVGLLASGLGKELATPSSPITPLLDLHKHSMETLLSGSVPVRRQYFSLYEVVVSIFMCLLLALISARIKTKWSITQYVFLFFTVWGLAIISYQQSGVLFSPLLPSISLVFGCFFMMVVKFHHFQVKARYEVEDTLVLLKSSEENLRSILNTIPDIVFRLDTRGRITFISPAISKYLLGTDELLGRSIMELVAPEDREKAKHRLTERRRGERATVDLEVKLLLSRERDLENGQQFFSISAEGIYTDNDSGVPSFLGTQGIVRDISDRKKLEIQLIQAKKMEAVGNLASGVAHDLNNILSGLVSYPDLLLLEIPKENALHEKISLIQKSGKKAAVIVQDLLTLARRGVENNEICNMNTIVKEYLSSVEFRKVQGRYPQVELRTRLEAEVMHVEGSPTHLSKALMNLVHNSFESMLAHGEIVITTKNVRVDEPIDGYEQVPQGEYICLTVSDTGSGISKKELRRVFEPFYTRKEMSRSGTGLGMTVIWATTKDHGGYIDIASQEGEGTHISLYLPVTKKRTKAADSDFILEDHLGSETLLVVDNIPEQLKIAQSILTKLGYRVLTAEGGKQAFDILEKQNIDLVVLDMIMRERLDGLETYREMIKRVPGQKAIITSGFSDSEKVREIQGLGAGEYVQKPYTMTSLAVAVRRELDKGAVQPTE